MLKGQTATVLISQAFRGRAFGSISSNDVAKRISVGEDGSIYLAGITTAHDEDHDAWGDVHPEESTGKRDIFIAKLSVTGELQWVKRTGSTQDDDLNDFKLANDALYLCGSTVGNFGRPVNGSSDAYIMKFSLNGERLWKKPFQFGSKGKDVCNAIDIDESGRVYVVGSTNGQMYGTTKPDPKSFHHFVAKLEESPGSPSGLRTVIGRQRGSIGNSSANQVAVVDDLLYVMTSSSRQQSRGETHATYLNIIDLEALFLLKLHMLKSHHGVSFEGVRMATSAETKNAYFVGFTVLDDMRKKYDVLKFNYSQNYKQGGIEWGSLLGPVSLSFKMRQFSGVEESKDSETGSIVMDYQLPSIVVDEKNRSVYVAGTEDGFYRSSSAHDEGLVVAPFYKLNATSGEVVERWHRSTNIPHDRQELTDIAMDPLRTVVYTGAWWLGAEAKSSVLLGSFGSTVRSSIADEWSTKPSFIQESTQPDGNTGPTSAHSARAGSIIMFTIACIGVAIVALFAIGSRFKKSNPKKFRSIESQEDELDNISIDPRNVIKFPAGSNDKLIGGSSGPQ
ncbi:Quinoprotein alcohol dehydrogenase-like protein [Gracilaria domingensis]|nr:Quinoprotein alcohol dehydrogenase-like protein [Gracilaria domingensis]